MRFTPTEIGVYVQYVDITVAPQSGTDDAELIRLELCGQVKSCVWLSAKNLFCFLTVFFVLSAGVEVKIAIRKERCFENVFAEYDFRGMDQVVIGFMTKVVNG